MNSSIRKKFPSLTRKHNGKPIIYLDGPAGTQVPNKVINAISDYYKTSNANTHGHFVTTLETDQLVDQTRKQVAAFMGASSAKEISFGQNMTTLNYSLSRAIGRTLEEGDEIIITQLDHESNRAPWLALKEYGAVIKEVKLKSNGLLDYTDLAKKISSKTKLVAMGWAANITGTVNDVEKVRKLCYQHGAWLLIDAVHYAAHFPMDVTALGCDFLLCSAYKFYGPHVGLLYCKKGLLDRLPTDRLRTAYQMAPYSIETGTLNHAALAGVSASLEFIASIGSSKKMRNKLVNGMQKIAAHEYVLAKKLYSGISRIKGVKVIGPSFKDKHRAPTISFYSNQMSANEICAKLAKKNIFAWAGHFYAIRATEVLGLLDSGGVTRMGISMYTSEAEVSQTIAELKKILA